MELGDVSPSSVQQGACEGEVNRWSLECCDAGLCYRYSRMRTVTQGHKRQQRPVVFSCWVLAILKADPSFNLRTPRVMEVDDTDEWGERSQGGQGRHSAVIRNMQELDKVESQPCARLTSLSSVGRGGVGGDDHQPCAAKPLSGASADLEA